MWTFLLCGIAFLLLAWQLFKNRVFYPSVIFCFMWGLNCIFHFLIYIGYVNPLTSVSDFEYTYMNTYIIYFTIATFVGFGLAHVFNNNHRIQMDFSVDYLDGLLKRYKWIMWLNFFGGILRIIVMVSLVGFSFSNIIEYRLAANAMMMYTHGGLVGWVFRLTAYINMLAIMYVSFSGLRAGLTRLNMKDSLIMFILFAPVQLATGGRLFILFFIIFYFGCFFLGRGITLRTTNRKWLLGNERRAIVNMLILMAPIVVAVTLSRGEGGFENIKNNEGSFLDPFSYISDGTMTTDKCMDFFVGGKNLSPAGGTTTFLGSSTPEYLFREYKHTSTFASSVYTVIVPLFLDYGYWGSLIAWGVLAFLMETLSLKFLSRVTLIRFVVYAMLLKMCYESVLANPFAGNIPFFELIILLIIFKRTIFDNYQKSKV